MMAIYYAMDCDGNLKYAFDYDGNIAWSGLWR